MKLKIGLLTFALILFTGILQAKTRLIVNCFWNPSHFVCVKILPGWINEVKRVTDGRVTGFIPPKSVAPPPEQLASVEKGIVDAAVQFNGLIQNRVTGPMVAMQPFIGNRNAGAMSRALWETNRKFFPKEFKTVELLTQFVISPGQLYSQTDKPINSIKEFSSRKMWVLPGPLAAIAKKLGTGVVSSPAVKSNEIISRGVVDGFIGLDPQAVKAFQLLPYTKSNTRFSRALYSTSFSFFINKDKWAEISAADQAAIMKISGEALAVKFGNGWNAENDAAESVYESGKIKVINADPKFEEALVSSSRFVVKKWLKDAKAAGIDGQAALDFYQARIAELVK